MIKLWSSASRLGTSPFSKTTQTFDFQYILRSSLSLEAYSELDIVRPYFPGILVRIRMVCTSQEAKSINIPSLPHQRSRFNGTLAPRHVELI